MVLTIMMTLLLIFLSGIFIQQRIVNMLNKAAELSVAPKPRIFHCSPVNVSTAS
jgi:hypothetical protein